MTDSEYGTEGVTDEVVLGEGETYAGRAQERIARGEVLGVLTGQVPVRSMPVVIGGRRAGKTKAAEDWLAEREGGSE